MTPDEWLADFEAKTAELQRNAVAFRRNLEAAGQTVTSDDKALTVTVAPNGALLDLEIAQNPELAAKLMELVRQAREGAAATVLGEFRNAVGGQTGQLDTDVSVPAFSTPEPRKPKPVEDEDFSDNSIYRRP
ncbi:YbaB/EbfC family nucleoid-associated protein [Lentzea sp. NPDC054927]